MKVALAVVGLALCAGCDESSGPVSLAVDAATTAATTTPAAPPAPEPPKAPTLAIALGEYVVGAEHIPTSDPDVVGRLVANLTGKPHIEGENVSFDAPRAVKPSQVVAMLSALQKAKAKGALARTENRDKVIVPLAITFAAPGLPACTPAAFIAKDSRLSVWTVGGQVAKSFSKGFAGPDMTLGTEAVRSLAVRCDGSALVVAADEAMIWGLVYDLATMSMVAPAGSVAKTTQIVVAPGSIVPGRKVTLE